jgi:hypothetical protein
LPAVVSTTSFMFVLLRGAVLAFHRLRMNGVS